MVVGALGLGVPTVGEGSLLYLFLVVSITVRKGVCFGRLNGSSNLSRVSMLSVYRSRLSEV